MYHHKLKQFTLIITSVLKHYKEFRGDTSRNKFFPVLLVDIKVLLKLLVNLAYDITYSSFSLNSRALCREIVKITCS